MPDILVQLEDEVDPDGFDNVTAQLPKRGDIVTYHDFPGTWGEWFLDNPKWKIVSINCKSSDLVGYGRPEMLNASVANQILQFRNRKVDPDKLVDGMTFADLQTVTTMKTPISNPNIIENSKLL